MTNIIMGKFPKISEDQVVVVMVDGSTGIVLNVDREIYKNDVNKEEYLIFDSIEDAHKFIKKISDLDDRIEFWIYDYKQEVLICVKSSRYG